MSREIRAALAMAAVALLGSPGAPRGAPIESPTGESPSSVAAGDEISVVIALRLPLTPPPGVQQPHVRAGWSVRLSRLADAVVGGASGRLSYTSRIVRIRPVEGRLYRLTAELLPWMPPGLYDLEVRGPGIDAMEPAAVAVNGPSAARELTVVVPASWHGAIVRVEGEVLRPSLVVWAALDGASVPRADRAIVFEIPSDGASGGGPGRIEIDAAKAGPAPCEADIVFSGGGPFAPTDWVVARLEAKPSPVSVTWDLGQGAWGAGPTVRHRWLIGEAPRVRAAAFDEAGRACVVEERVPIRDPLERTGCSCAAVGRSTSGLLGGIDSMVDIFSCPAGAARNKMQPAERSTR